MIDKNKPFDMNVWYPDVVKIITSKYRQKMEQTDAEDIIHEVCEALIKKSSSPNSCYHKELSSPSHYILMVADCVIKNRYHKEKKHMNLKSLEELVATTPKILSSDPKSNELFQTKRQLSRFETYLSERDPKFIHYVKMIRDGHNLKTIGNKEKVNPNVIKVRLQTLIESFKTSLCSYNRCEIDEMNVKIDRVFGSGNFCQF
jgi:DNA-directed RNA polymerase specialized sigma24 family protein